MIRFGDNIKITSVRNLILFSPTHVLINLVTSQLSPVTPNREGESKHMLLQKLVKLLHILQIAAHATSQCSVAQSEESAIHTPPHTQFTDAHKWLMSL